MLDGVLHGYRIDLRLPLEGIAHPAGKELGTVYLGVHLHDGIIVGRKLLEFVLNTLLTILAAL